MLHAGHGTIMLCCFRAHCCMWNCSECAKHARPQCGQETFGGGILCRAGKEVGVLASRKGKGQDHPRMRACEMAVNARPPANFGRLTAQDSALTAKFARAYVN